MLDGLLVKSALSELLVETRRPKHATELALNDVPVLLIELRVRDTRGEVVTAGMHAGKLRARRGTLAQADAQRLEKDLLVVDLVVVRALLQQDSGVPAPVDTHVAQRQRETQAEAEAEAEADRGRGRHRGRHREETEAEAEAER